MKLHSKLKEDTHFVTALGLCDLLLMNNQLYPWLILVPRVEGAVELIDLDQADQYRLMDEIRLTSQLLRDIYQPDKLNIASLGNIVRQLHVHIIGRYRSDPAWPSPIWGHPSTPYSQDNCEKTISLLKRKILT